MKLILVFLLIFLFINNSIAQNAIDFSCKDCSGINHQLFAELDAGKVVVICWIMPCGSCLPPAFTTYNVVESYQTSNPDKVKMYLCDDYANNSCTTISSWANNNNMNNCTKFSDVSIKMSDYATVGMPKIVVLGSPEHKVYYNSDNSVNSDDLQVAIEAAISELNVNKIENPSIDFVPSIYPNPSKSISYLNIYSFQNQYIDISIYNQLGQKVSDIYSGNFQGESQFPINTLSLKSGFYYVRVNYSEYTEIFKLIVNH